MIEDVHASFPSMALVDRLPQQDVVDIEEMEDIVANWMMTGERVETIFEKLHGLLP